MAECDACVEAGGCGQYRPGDEGWGRGSRSVMKVNSEDAQNYLRWLSRETGTQYRLLTEAEQRVGMDRGLLERGPCGGPPQDGSARESGDWSQRVLRGGSWSGIPGNLSSAFRFGASAGVRNVDLGFRVARAVN